MQKGIKFIPLEAITGRVLEVLPNNTVNESVLLEWAYEAYENIITHSAYEKHVAILQVQNHKAKVPCYLFSLDMVVYTEEDLFNNPTDSVKSSITETTTVSTEILNSDDTTHTLTTTVVETNSPLNKPDNKNIVKGTVDGHITIEDLQRFNTSGSSRWKPLQMSSNSYHNAILINTSNSIITESQRRELYKSCKHSFTIHKGCFVTTFSSGTIAVAYNGLPKDEDGGYTIPDLEYVKMAIETYCLMRYWQKRFNMMQDGAQQRYSTYKQEWQFLAPKASGQLEMPDFIEYQNLRNINKFIKEDSPFAIATGAGDNRESLLFGNTRNTNFYLR